ncbi:hypothetical protein, partial [Snodgrassella sp. CFCC 13594]|uniref:hypothetical protein n=1 Tax=Snodgrassella sp. CFCC 13594 TaxID=1775559 RepID=UPI000A96ED28
EVANAAREVAQEAERLSKAATEYQEAQQVIAKSEANETGGLITNDSFDVLLSQWIKGLRNLEQEERMFDRLG